MTPLALVTSPRFVDQALPAHLRDRAGGHPERPDRIRAVWSAIEAADLRLLRLEPDAPADDAALLRVHTPAHLAHVAASAGGYADAGETYVGPHSDAVARLGVACGLRAADAVMSGDARRAFAAVRPPGHHAEPDRAMGFCLYGNAALIVRHLQQIHGLARVAVIDFDVHHGNGTQAAFYDDPSVLTVSLHGDPRTLWPGTGYAHETGVGDGRGYAVNVPLPPGTGDAAYLRALRDLALPRVRAFRPEALVVSAGFDAHAADPLAGLMLSSDGFAAIGRELAKLADEVCDGRLVATLEGGYDLPALGESLVAFLRPLTVT